MTGFWAGAVPPWAYAVGACLWILALTIGMWVGYGRGWAHCEEDQDGGEEDFGIERPPELAAARFQWHVLSECPDEGPCPIHGQVPPEVAHDWGAHVGQALSLAAWAKTPPAESYEWDQPPDLRPDLTDSQWMAYKLADLDQFMAGLLGTHPATEEL